MSEYGWVLLLTLGIAVPGMWLLGVNPWCLLRRSWLSILLLSIPYVVWDIWATSGGVWNFNDDKTLGITFFHLPLEEIVFFFVVPYASLGWWVFLSSRDKEALKNTPHGKEKSDGQYYMWAYTSVASFSLFTFLVLDEGSRTRLIRQRRFWLFQLAVLPWFFLINGWLTGSPIVLYNSAEFSDLRIGTIPLEDFLYSFAWLGLQVWGYEMSQRFLRLRSGKF